MKDYRKELDQVLKNYIGKDKTNNEINKGRNKVRALKLEDGEMTFILRILLSDSYIQKCNGGYCITDNGLRFASIGGYTKKYNDIDTINNRNQWSFWLSVSSLVAVILTLFAICAQVYFMSEQKRLTETQLQVKTQETQKIEELELKLKLERNQHFLFEGIIDSLKEGLQERDMKLNSAYLEINKLNNKKNE